MAVVQNPGSPGSRVIERSIARKLEAPRTKSLLNVCRKKAYRVSYSDIITETISRTGIFGQMPKMYL